MKPNISSTVNSSQAAQVHARQKKSKPRNFAVGDSVLIWNYRGGSKLLPATVFSKSGPLSYTVELTNGSTVRRHIEQIIANNSGSVMPSSVSTSLNGNVPLLPDYSVSHDSGVRLESSDNNSSESLGSAQNVPIVDKTSDSAVEIPSIPERRYPLRDRKGHQIIDV